MAKASTRFPHLQLAMGLVVIVIGTAIVIGPTLTIQGVPVPIILKFLQDNQARQAYFSDNKEGLHARLQELNVEEDIKTFYRPQIPNEVQLDQHIHQVFYEATGYIGKAYQVNSEGTLVLIDRRFERWYPLALQAGVVVDSQYRNDIHYVVGPEGTVVPYRQVADVFPIKILRQLIRLKSEEQPLPQPAKD